MRYVLARKEPARFPERVVKQRDEEREMGLAKPETFDKFRIACEKSSEDLVGLLRDLKRQNKRVVGYAATSKSTTVLNYCQIGPDLIEEYISDSTPIKQGKGHPGHAHPGRVAPDVFHANRPDYAVLFGWNLQDRDPRKGEGLRRRGRLKWIVFVPQVQVL